MCRLAFVLFAILVLESPAYATWSVLAVDRRTGEVVIASATCVPQAWLLRFPARGLMDIQAIVVPGKGVAAAQADVDRSRSNQRLIFRELQDGTPPDAIIERLQADPLIETRQFGIVDLQGRTAAHTGTRNGPQAAHVVGRVPNTEIFFAIQGDILTSEGVVHDAAAAFERAAGELTDRTMVAMEAADRSGGDRRCSCSREPKVNAPCETKTAHVAYILKAGPNDTNGRSFNDGRYALYISVTDQDITLEENANPVVTLRMRYDAWKASRPPM